MPRATRASASVSKCGWPLPTAWKPALSPRRWISCSADQIARAGGFAAVRTRIAGSERSAYDGSIMSDLPITASHRAARAGFANSSRVLARLREEWPKSQQEHSFAEMFARKYFTSRGGCAAGTWESANKSPCPRHPRLPASVGNDGKPGPNGILAAAVAGDGDHRQFVR